jgi:hypothetical protein
MSKERDMALQTPMKRPAPAGAEARAVDLWLQKQLLGAYGTSLTAPLPSELITLAQHFDS